MFNETRLEEKDKLSIKFDSDFITKSIKTKKNAAPGTNRISFKLLDDLININDNLAESIAKELNYIHSSRPICLLNPLLKIYNKKYYKSLTCISKKTNILPNNSYGFRKQKNISEYFINLMNDIYSKNRSHKSQILITTD